MYESIKAHDRIMYCTLHFSTAQYYFQCTYITHLHRNAALFFVHVALAQKIFLSIRTYGKFFLVLLRTWQCFYSLSGAKYFLSSGGCTMQYSASATTFAQTTPIHEPKIFTAKNDIGIFRIAPVKKHTI